jgi:transcriptional regulator with XRE-family HTH domain
MWELLMKLDDLAIGTRLRTIRGKISQADFAQLIGVARSSLVHYEAGTRTIAADVVFNVATQFKIDAYWLLAGVGLPKLQLAPKEALLLEHFRAIGELGQDTLIQVGYAMREGERVNALGKA